MPYSTTLTIKDRDFNAGGPETTIEILSVSWGVSQGGVHGSGSGGITKAQVHDLIVSFRHDAASPKLWSYSASGRHISKIVIVMSRETPEGKLKPFETIELTDVVISSFHMGGSGKGDDVPIESVGLNFASVDVKFDASGTTGTPAGENVDWTQ